MIPVRYHGLLRRAKTIPFPVEALFRRINVMISYKVKIRWQSKKLQIQGAQILRNEAYLQYAAMTKDVAQRRSWTFFEAIKCHFFKVREEGVV